MNSVRIAFGVLKPVVDIKHSVPSFVGVPPIGLEETKIT